MSETQSPFPVADKDADDDANRDFVGVLLGITNFIQNERVRAYNEGLDAGRLSRSTAGDEGPPREPTDAMVDAAELKMPGLGRLQIRFLYETMVAAAAHQSTADMEGKP
jgi:hypothetical protein